jgi:hypothetical protein
MSTKEREEEDECEERGVVLVGRVVCAMQKEGGSGRGGLVRTILRRQ